MYIEPPKQVNWANRKYLVESRAFLPAFREPTDQEYIETVRRQMHDLLKDLTVHEVFEMLRPVKKLDDRERSYVITSSINRNIVTENHKLASFLTRLYYVVESIRFNTQLEKELSPALIELKEMMDELKQFTLP